MNMRRPFVFVPVLILLVAIGAAFAGWRWLMHSESGARWVFERAVIATGNALSASRLDGTLASGIQVDAPAFVNDSVTVGSNNLSTSVGVELSPLTVVVRSLDVAGLAVTLGPPKDDDAPGPGLRDVLHALALPLRIRFEGASISGVRVSDAADATLFAADEVELDATWDERFNIGGLAVRAPAGTLTAAGRIALIGSNALDLKLRFEPTDDQSPLYPQLALDLDGDPDAMAVLAVLREATVTGQLFGLDGEPRWQAQLSASVLEWPTPPDSSPIAGYDMALSADGDFRQYRFDGSARLDLPGLNVMPVRLNGNGDLESLALALVDLHDGQVTGSAGLSWTDGIRVTAGLRLDAMRPATLLKNYSGEQVVNGELSGEWAPGRILLHDSRLVVDVGDRQLTVSGAAGVVGDPEDWRLDGDVNIGTTDYPSGRFVVAGYGNRDELTIDTLDGQLLGGTISGAASYRWADEQPWTANLEFDGIDTASLPFDWPAVLNGKVDAEGSMQPLAVIGTLTDVNGRLLSREFSANGTVAMRGDDIEAQRLAIRHGSSNAFLDGRLYHADGFSFDIAVDELGHYVDGAAGSFTADGRASLQEDQPFLELNATSDDIAVADFRAVDVRIRDRRESGTLFGIQATAESVVGNGRQLDAVEVSASAGRDAQSLELAGTLADFRINAMLTGAADDIRAPARWNGRLDRFELTDGESSAALTGPASVTLSRQDFELTGFCIDGDLRLHLCADLDWRAERGFDASAELRSLPLELVNQFAATGLSFDQLVTGTATWQQRADGTVSGTGGLNLSAGTVTSKARPDDTLATGAGRLGFDIRDGKLLAGDISLPLPGVGNIAGQFQVDDLGEGTDSGVAGGVDIELADLALLEGIFPLVDRLGGSLSARLDLTGSVLAPRITGDARLRNGALAFQPIGLMIEDLTLDSELDTEGNILLTGDFRAGEGRGKIVTRSNTAAGGGGVELGLQGENLTLIDVPDLRVVVNPDIDLGYDGKALNIDGTILVPSARVRPQNIGVSRVSESEDVVVVAGTLPEADQESAAPEDFQVFGTLEVAFGQDIALLLDVAQTNLTGSTTFTWSGDPVPQANGRYDVDGEILVFGQRLEIIEGGVRFPNVPADDPVVRVRAIREIYGNTEIKEAGVMVTGSLRNPTVETFTVPMTTEERALTLLVTGSDFDYEQGVGAIDFGTYVAPKLYASYGIGLFDQENVVRLRYDITRGFGVIATSGQKDSGLDLSYRFEN